MARVGNDAADQATLDYVASARLVQDLLRQVLTQVAGYSLLLMTSDKPSMRPEASILTARQAAERARDGVRALRVPASAAHHHHHLSLAAEATRQAFTAAEACALPGVTEGERDQLSRVLAAATGHLRTTAKLLPGFEMIDFGQACCAAHARAAFAAQASENA